MEHGLEGAAGSQYKRFHYCSMKQQSTAADAEAVPSTEKESK